MNRPSFPHIRGWTSLELTIWFLVMIAVITVGILLATNVVGSLVVFVMSCIVLAFVSLRYWLVTERAKRDAAIAASEHEDREVP